MKCASPRAASAGWPAIRLRTSPPNLLESASVRSGPLSASKSSCCSSLVSSGCVSIIEGTRSRLRTWRSGISYGDLAVSMLLTSWKTSGGSRISFSCGYCESHATSAPESNGPICTSSNTPRLAAPPQLAYIDAMSRSVVVPVKPISVPPRGISSLAGRQNESGSVPFARPQYTTSDRVRSFDRRTIALEHAWIVVEYVLPRFCSSKSRRRHSCPGILLMVDRKATWTLRYIGPR